MEAFQVEIAADVGFDFVADDFGADDIGILAAGYGQLFSGGYGAFLVGGAVFVDGFFSLAGRYGDADGSGAQADAGAGKGAAAPGFGVRHIALAGGGDIDVSFGREVYIFSRHVGADDVDVFFGGGDVDVFAGGHAAFVRGDGVAFDCCLAFAFAEADVQVGDGLPAVLDRFDGLGNLMDMAGGFDRAQGFQPFVLGRGGSFQGLYDVFRQLPDGAAAEAHGEAALLFFMGVGVVVVFRGRRDIDVFAGEGDVALGDDVAGGYVDVFFAGDADAAGGTADGAAVPALFPLVGVVFGGSAADGKPEAAPEDAALLDFTLVEFFSRFGSALDVDVVFGGQGDVLVAYDAAAFDGQGIFRLDGDLFPAEARFYGALFVFDVVADGGSGAGDAVPGIFTPFFDEGLFFAGGDVNILSGMKGELFRRIDFRGSGVDLTAGVERDVFAGGQGRADVFLAAVVSVGVSAKEDVVAVGDFFGVEGDVPARREVDPSFGGDFRGGEVDVMFGVQGQLAVFFRYLTTNPASRPEGSICGFPVVSMARPVLI